MPDGFVATQEKVEKELPESSFGGNFRAPPPKHSNILLIIICVFFIIALVLLAVVFNRNAPKKTGYIIPTPPTIVVPSEVPAISGVDITTNWKTLTESRYGFEYKYPPEAEVVDAAGTNPPQYRVRFMGAKQIASGRTQTSLFDGYIFIVSVRGKIGETTVEQVANETYEGTKSSCEQAQLSAINAVTINSVSAKTYNVTNCLGDYAETFISDGENIFEITQYYAGDATDQPKYQQVTNQILSTFKFIDTINNIESSEVIITKPQPSDVIHSPVTVTGTVPAGWMFEGSFPIKLLDVNKKLIAQGIGKEVTPGTWSSGSPVQFSASVSFSTTATNGFIRLEKDNPSGLPENDASIEIPVKF